MRLILKIILTRDFFTALLFLVCRFHIDGAAFDLCIFHGF